MTVIPYFCHSKNRHTYIVPSEFLKVLTKECLYTWKNQTNHTLAHEGSESVNPVVSHALGNITLSACQDGIQYITDCLHGHIFRFIVTNSVTPTAKSEIFESQTPAPTLSASSVLELGLGLGLGLVLVFLLAVPVAVFVIRQRRHICGTNRDEERVEVQHGAEPDQSAADPNCNQEINERQRFAEPDQPISISTSEVHSNGHLQTPLPPRSQVNGKPCTANGSTSEVHSNGHLQTPLLPISEINGKPCTANGSNHCVMDESNKIAETGL